MRAISQENSLKHFGIPGMKWGVRRSEERLARQNGRKEYNDAKTKSKEQVKATLERGKTVAKETRNLRDIQPYKQTGGIVTKFIGKTGKIYSSKDIDNAVGYIADKDFKRQKVLAIMVLASMAAPAIIAGAKAVASPEFKSSVSSGLNFMKNVDLKSIRYDNIAKAFVGVLR